MGHWRNPGGNLKVPSSKWKWKYNVPECVGYSKNSSEREVHSFEPRLKNKIDFKYIT
jgi:hypothetical protein